MKTKLTHSLSIHTHTLTQLYTCTSQTDYLAFTRLQLDSLAHAHTYKFRTCIYINELNFFGNGIL